MCSSDLNNEETQEHQTGCTQRKDEKERRCGAPKEGIGKSGKKECR